MRFDPHLLKEEEFNEFSIIVVLLVLDNIYVTVQVFYLMLTLTGMSGGRRRSDFGDRHAGDDAPLLPPEPGPAK